MSPGRILLVLCEVFVEWLLVIRHYIDQTIQAQKKSRSLQFSLQSIQSISGSIAGPGIRRLRWPAKGGQPKCRLTPLSPPQLFTENRFRDIDGSPETFWNVYLFIYYIYFVRATGAAE